MTDPVLTILTTPSPTILEDLEAEILRQFPGLEYHEMHWNIGLTTAWGTWIRFALAKPASLEWMDDATHANVIRLLTVGPYHGNPWGSRPPLMVSTETAVSLTRTGHLRYLSIYNWFNEKVLPMSTYLAILRVDGDFLWSETSRRIGDTRYPEAERRELLPYVSCDTLNRNLYDIVAWTIAGKISVEFCRELLKKWGTGRGHYSPREVYNAAKLVGAYTMSCITHYSTLQQVINPLSNWTAGPRPTWFSLDLLADLNPRHSMNKDRKIDSAEWNLARAQRVFALIVGMGGGELRIGAPDPDDPFVARRRQIVRFLQLAAHMPLELQAILAARSMGSGRTTLTLPDYAVRWALGIWAWPGPILV